jgi:hypothetical protein
MGNNKLRLLISKGLQIIRLIYQLFLLVWRILLRVMRKNNKIYL